MKIGNLRVTAPIITGDNYNEVEVFGAAVWLWLHSTGHKKMPLDALPVLLLPPIKKQLFALFMSDNKPVGYIAWAFMNKESEHRYITLPEIMLQDSDWLSGDRLWFEDMTSPFGYTSEIISILRCHLLPDHIGRFLCHHGEKKGFKVKKYFGKNITVTEANQWLANNPIND